MQRSIAQLSGGEKKRVALALGLGFAEVVAARGRLTSNALILDEVGEGGREGGCMRLQLGGFGGGGRAALYYTLGRVGG